MTKAEFGLLYNICVPSVSLLAVYMSQLSEILHGFAFSPGEAGEKWE